MLSQFFGAVSSFPKPLLEGFGGSAEGAREALHARALLLPRWAACSGTCPNCSTAPAGGFRFFFPAIDGPHGNGSEIRNLRPPGFAFDLDEIPKAVRRRSDGKIHFSRKPSRSKRPQLPEIMPRFVTRKDPKQKVPLGAVLLLPTAEVRQSFRQQVTRPMRYY